MNDVAHLVRFALPLALLLTGSCVYFPQFEPREPTHAVAPNPQSRIAHHMGPARLNEQRATLVTSAPFALTSRLDLIDAADSSLDLQYFIWENDPSGIVAIEKVLAAADRGVRVRALLDDVRLEGLVNRLSALNSHPNITVRIFNPFSVRWRYRLGFLRLAEFAIDGNRLNHRMHNKLFVVDNQVAMLGGRNIGDDYFGRSRERNFIDLDIVLTGPVVSELSTGFDAYWNSRWAYPVDELFNVSMVPDELTKLRERLRRRIARHPDLDALAQAQDYAATLDELSQGAPVDAALVVVDEPSVAWLDEPDQLANALNRIAASARNEVLVVTPYLIPTPELLDITPNLIERGVRIRIVTNSLTTNDVVIAQAAYSHYRQRIVDAGIELYELRDDAELARSLHSDDISLHQKYIVFDGKSVFVGSMNLDHRSLYLNTELGVLVESPELATELADMFDELVSPDNSWRIIRTDTGVAWQSSAGTLQRQPAKSWWQRLRHWFYRLLPVSRQL